jgi:hypothetical protein
MSTHRTGDVRAHKHDLDELAGRRRGLKVTAQQVLDALSDAIGNGLMEHVV